MKILNTFYKTRKYLALTIPFFILLSGCLDVIKPDLKEGPPLLVVDGWLTNRKNNEDIIWLSMTLPYFQGGIPQKVSGAKVILKNSMGEEETLGEIEPGAYKISKMKASEGLSYTLNIDYDGESYLAENKTVKPGIIVDKAILRPTNYAKYILFISGRIVSDKDNACRFKIKTNGSQHYEPLIDIINGDILEEGNFTDFRINNIAEYDTDKVNVETWSIGDQGFEFYRQLLEATQHSGGIFSPPASNVMTNVKNTNPAGKPAVGYFGAAIVSEIEAVAEQ